MSDTPRLNLPLLAAAQAQKHVTHNEAIASLDAIVQLAVVVRDQNIPPSSPPAHARYHVGAAPTGVWSNEAGSIAEWRDGAWVHHRPRAGWIMWVSGESRLFVYDGTSWIAPGDGGVLQSLQQLGLGTAATPANPFAARLNNALWTALESAAGGDGDLRLTLNKESAGDVLSLLFQSGFSGCAEIGLVGDNNATVRVSPDGATWIDVLVVDRATGTIRFLPAASAGMGIGTAAPSERLHVQGSVRADGFYTQSAASTVGLNAYFRGGWRTPANAPGAFFMTTGTSSDVELWSLPTLGVDAVATPALRFRFGGTGAFLPGGNNTQNMGSATARWATIFAGTGTINTSDARNKQVRGPLSDTELDIWDRVEPAVFRHRDAVAAKGDAARLHVGYVAQTIEESFARHDEDASRYALFCKDEDTLGLRYDQCALLEAAWTRRELRRLRKRVEALEQQHA